MADREVCGLKPPLPHVVACSQIAFQLQLNYRKEQSPVGEKGRGKQDLTSITLLHSTTCFMLLTAENSFPLPVLSNWHFFQCVTLLEVFTRYACLLSKTTLRDRGKTKYGSLRHCETDALMVIAIGRRIISTTKY